MKLIKNLLLIKREITPKWHTNAVSTLYERTYQNVPKISDRLFITCIIMSYC